MCCPMICLPLLRRRAQPVTATSYRGRLSAFRFGPRFCSWRLADAAAVVPRWFLKSKKATAKNSGEAGIDARRSARRPNPLVESGRPAPPLPPRGRNMIGHPKAFP